MATMITDECINCGACEPECPNTAIYQGGVEYEALDGTKHPPLSNDFFYIVPEKCTECVGFFDQEACAAVCPVDCCVPDPGRVESEELLAVRAKEIHPDKDFSGELPSRFRKPAAGDGAVAPPVGGATAATAPMAAGAANSRAPMAAPMVRFGKIERKIEPLAAPVARSGPVADALPIEFADALNIVSAGAPVGAGSRLVRLLVCLGQPLLGALPAAAKVRLEEAMGDRRIFSASGATAFNIMLHVLLLPLLAIGFAVLVEGESIYTRGLTAWFFFGMMAAIGEALWRLREAVIFARPVDEVVWRGSIYGVALLPVAMLLASRAGAARRKGEVSVEGFYGQDTAFDDKRERERRYGEIYAFEERPDGWVLRLELPRRIPPSGVRDQLGLGEIMPDYELTVRVLAGALQVHGRVVDERLRVVAATAPAFPPDFTMQVPLRERPLGFVQQYADKLLEIVVLKPSAIDKLPRAADAA